jgi:hypothetical protein
MKKHVGTVHVSAFVPQDVAKAAKIQAITEGLTLQDWITQAIIRQLAESGKIPEGRAWGDRLPATDVDGQKQEAV